jgi:hypothetical protein
MNEPSEKDYEDWVLRERPNSLAAAHIKVGREMRALGESLRSVAEQQIDVLSRFARHISRAARKPR